MATLLFLIIQILRSLGAVENSGSPRYYYDNQVYRSQRTYTARLITVSSHYNLEIRLIVDQEDVTAVQSQSY